ARAWHCDDVHRACRRPHGDPDQLRPGRGTDPIDLRVRGRDHRRARAPVGDATRRHGAGRRPGGWGRPIARPAGPRRPYRLPDHPARAPERVLSAHEGLILMGAFRVERATRESRAFAAVLIIGLLVLASLPYWGGFGNMRLVAEMAYYLALAQLWNL